MTRRPSALHVLALALSLALAACEEAPQSRLIDMRSAGTMSFARAAAADGPFYLETIGTPFARGVALDGAVFARHVAEAFAQPSLRFTTVKAEAPQSDYRMVWVFDPPDSLQLDALCTGQATPGPTRRAEILQVAAAFCHQTRLFAVARGSVKRPVTGDEGPWRQLVQQIARHLVTDGRPG